jgi:hypothetical protein
MPTQRFQSNFREGIENTDYLQWHIEDRSFQREIPEEVKKVKMEFEHCLFEVEMF